MHAPKRKLDTNRVSFTFDEFCTRNGIGRTTGYKEIAAGRLRTFKVGRLRRVSAEAEQDWIRTLEREAAA